MLANVFTKSVVDRWRGMTVAAVGLGAMLWLGMLAYSELDLTVYEDLPDVMRSLINIGEDLDAGGLAYGAIYASYGTLTLASLALSIGSRSIAGEEEDRTIAVLLANPVGRGSVLLQKLGSMLVLVGAGAVVLWLAGLAVPVMLGVDVGDKHVGALVVHMYTAAVFFGALAAAIGGWTGRRALASGTTALIMVGSFLADGIFPVVGWDGALRFVPWHWFQGGDPVSNGVQWGGLGLLVGAAAALAVAAVVAVDRRDLGTGRSSGGVRDRLEALPGVGALLERLAGTTRARRIWSKTLADHQALVVIVASTLVFFGVVMGPMFLAIDDALTQFMDQVPEAILAMVGYADMSTPEGWYQTENFSVTVPIALMIATITMGARALAGEEADRTMGLLLGNPVSRRRIVVEKSLAMALVALGLGLATFLGTYLGSLAAGLGMSPARILATSLLAGLLAFVMGLLALAIGAATGRVATAAVGAAGVALLAYVVDAFFPLAESLEGLAAWSPFHYYLSADPLNAGMPWGHAALLAVLAVLLLIGAVVLFERRDLRLAD
ncbi:MAG: ABC transporter permease subunit [Acidimicrobiia bacterium]|nr:ABC transporter permease subunit [Acidimicrobiia bacterium]